MKKLCTIIILAAAMLVVPAAHAKSVCAASDPNRFSAVLSSGGYADFVADRDGNRLFYRVDASRLTNPTGARIQRAGANVLDLMANGQTFVDGVLEGSLAVSETFLEDLYADPSLFSLNVGGTPARLNGRGSVLMAGSLAAAGGGAAGKIRPDVAANAMGVFSLGFVDDDPSSDDVRVDFDLMTDSIHGFDTASVVLVDGDTASDILDLVNVDGFTNGRLRGSVRLSREELERIVANPSGYHLQFRSPDDGMFSGEMGEAVTTFIPAFGRTQNAFGNHFTSDLRLYNPGNRPANVFIQFFPAGATEPLAGNVAVIRLEPGQARVINDAVPTLFGSSAGIGSLRIVSSGQVIADSEILDDVPSSGGGVQSNAHAARLGQFVGGIGNCSAVTHGLLTSLAASSAADGFRTNILLGNPGVRAAFARFELRNEQGRLLDARTLDIPAHAQMLMPLGGASGLFHNATGELRNAVVTMHANTPLFLGSSLVQNGSGDARFTTARDISLPVKMD